MTVRFEELPICPEILRAIGDMGFEEASPIQALTIPRIMAGRDVIGQAQTGTGKTAAFGIPLLERIDVKRKEIQAMVLCPTRELAIQVAEEITSLAMHKKGLAVLPVYGGQPIERQIKALVRGVHVIVGTPGRVIDHLERGTIDFSNVLMAVLDEADEMLDMGFREDIERILESAPEFCQTVFFSATMPKPIIEMANRFLRDPEHLAVTQKQVTVPSIEQHYFELRPHQKLEALCRLLDANNLGRVIIFCSTKKGVDDLTSHLLGRGFQADGLHGNLTQSQRERVMQRFRSSGIEILVATDVAARGLDVDDVEAVFNYDIPNDVEDYVHRIGRTGRAGRSGRAFTFVTAREFYKLRDIMKYTKAKIVQSKIPTLEDVAGIKTAKLLEEVSLTLAAGNLDRQSAMVQTLLVDDHTSLDVAAALMHLLILKETPAQHGDVKDFDDNRGRGGDRYERNGRRDSGDRNGGGRFDRGDRGDRGDRHGRGRDERGGRFERNDRGGDRGGDRFERGNRPSFGRDRHEGGDYGNDRQEQRRDPEPGMSRLFLNVGHKMRIGPRDIVGAIAGETGLPGKMIGAIDIRDRFAFVEVPTEHADEVMNVMSGNQIRGYRIVVDRANLKD